MPESLSTFSPSYSGGSIKDTTNKSLLNIHEQLQVQHQAHFEIQLMIVVLVTLMVVNTSNKIDYFPESGAPKFSILFSMREFKPTGPISQKSALLSCNRLVWSGNPPPLLLKLCHCTVKNKRFMGPDNEQAKGAWLCVLAIRTLSWDGEVLVFGSYS